MKKGMPGLMAALLPLVLLPTCKKEELVLSIPAGDTSAGFQLKPTDNALLKGHQTLEFSIAETAGAIAKRLIN